MHAYDNHLNNTILYLSIFVIEGQSDKNTKIYIDKMQEGYQCKSQCFEKSSESFESNNCHVCCKSKSNEPYCCKKQCKTVDICSSNDSERPGISDQICRKLSCIIKRLDHLIDICPSQNDSLNDHLTMNQPDKTDTNLKNERKKLPQEIIIPVNTRESSVKSLPETKVQPIKSKTTCPVNIPCGQNPITVIHSNDKSCRELQSIDLCTEVKDENQKESCGNIDNPNIIKDNETNENIRTEKAPAKPKPPIPVKIIKNIVTTKPITLNRSRLVQNTCFDEIKVEKNSKNTQLSSSEKKSINKR